ncbi:MAG: GntR family transcriptional regulator [Sporomusa sp.]|jgi:GntR family transcriptional repressor for pyruvate dehydrogenase complex|nr:GntR family transcriptional regulator [Sporomusa sp.]
MSEKINRIKLSQIIIGRIKEIIQNDKFNYGDKLPVEKRLAEMFGVSRTTIREALAVLAAEGWVTAKRGGGTYVDRIRNQAPIEPLTASLDSQGSALFDIMEFRRILEGEVAMLAALRATDEDMAAIKAAYFDMADAVSQDKDTATSDFAIHYAIAKAAKNNTILSVIKQLHDSYTEVVKTSRGHSSKPGSYELILSEHRTIIKAIEKHQADAARKAMQTHLERSQRIIEEVLDTENSAKKEP